jgi:peptidoglycan lytic transglycosylase
MEARDDPMPLTLKVWGHRSHVGMVWLMNDTVNANHSVSPILSWHVFPLLLVLAVVLFSSGCTSKLVGEPNTAGKLGIRALGTGKAYNRPYTVKGQWYYPMASAKGYVESGIASWYGWESGNRTAMGESFDPRGLSAAHRTLPLPTKVYVTNLENNRSVIVIVNDRGPFIGSRLIDLSQGAAQQLGMRQQGTARVKVVAIDADMAAR